MFGAYTPGKKAAKFGYKRYGVPGAVASGGAALAGYVVVRRALRSATKSDADSDDIAAAVDAGAVKRAVEEQGLGAVTDRETLDAAINEEKLDAPVDVDEVQSAAAEESDEVALLARGDGRNGRREVRRRTSDRDSRRGASQTSRIRRVRPSRFPTPSSSRT